MLLSSPTHSVHKHIVRHFSTFAFLFLLMGLPGVGRGQAPTVTRVEEDWELIVTEAEPELSAPQITTFMIPDTNQQERLFSFHVNHATLPEESTGGLQVQAWSSTDSFRYKPQVGSEKLSWNTEVITWTQRLSVSNGYLYYSIRDFQSASFGTLNEHASLRIKVSTSLVDLESYSREDSLRESGANFSENRVQHLVLRRVRYYDGSTLIKEDNVEQAVQNGSE